ncbi:MAG: YgeY family selenium metabolism-linked hydrolase [Candidatus Heimdallarchaeota archaeon]|nr:YgeY family selenium metabolism-linked hydrolase [Candidatus Heimdallarchaeota archaeon]
MNNQIKKLVENKEEELISLTRELVETHSKTGQEEQIIDLLYKKFTEIGFSEIIIDEMGNLIGKIGSGKNVLAIDGHVDTVEIGSLENWYFDPLKGKIEEGKIFGRGSCDQKGGLAAAIMTVKILREIGFPESLTLYIVASIHEEIFEGMNWQHIINEVGIIPDAVILTEPSNLQISIGHRGRVDIKIEVEGVSSHGADPDLGVNAIYKMAKIISEIEELHKRLPTGKIFGKNSIAVTDIKSNSVSLNAVADKCIIHVDRRLGDNETKETVLKEINNLPSIKKANAKVYISKFTSQSYKNFKYEIEGYYPSWIMKETDPLVQIAKIAFENQYNKKAQLRYWRFSTNGVATKGLNDIPTIGFGPGDERFAHTSNEHVPIEHLKKATEFYTAFCLEFSKK